MTDRVLIRLIAAGLLTVVIECVTIVALVDLTQQRLTIVGGVGTTALGALTAFLVSTHGAAVDAKQAGRDEMAAQIASLAPDD